MDNVLDKIKDLTGLSFENMNAMERDTAMQWANAMAGKQITLDDLRAFFMRLRLSVDKQLALHNLSEEEDLFLKARLKNLIALEEFLAAPVNLQNALDTYLKSINVKK